MGIGNKIMDTLVASSVKGDARRSVKVMANRAAQKQTLFQKLGSSNIVQNSNFLSKLAPGDEVYGEVTRYLKGRQVNKALSYIDDSKAVGKNIYNSVHSGTIPDNITTPNGIKVTSKNIDRISDQLDQDLPEMLRMKKQIKDTMVGSGEDKVAGYTAYRNPLEKIQGYYSVNTGARVGATVGVYGAASLLGRGITGGSLTRNGNGESDIVGIPLI